MSDGAGRARECPRVSTSARPPVLPTLRASPSPWVLSLGTPSHSFFSIPQNLDACVSMTLSPSDRQDIRFQPFLPLRGSVTLLPSPGRSGGPTAAAGSVCMRFQEAFEFRVQGSVP